MSAEITMVKMYLSEGDRALEKWVHWLHETEQVRGLTVFRGIMGYGQSGQLHRSNLLDATLDLPLTIEFFDTPDKIDKILTDIKSKIEPGKLVYWNAKVNE